MAQSPRRDEFAVDMETFNRKYNALVAKMKRIVNEKNQIENDMERYVSTLQKINMAARESAIRRDPGKKRGSIHIDARSLLKPEPVFSVSPVTSPTPPASPRPSNYVNEYEEFKKWRAEKYKRLDPILELKQRPVVIEARHASTSTSASASTSTENALTQHDMSKKVLGRMFVYNFKTKALKQNLFDPWPDEAKDSNDRRVTLDLVPYDMNTQNVTGYSEFLDEIAKLERNLDFLQRAIFTEDQKDSSTELAFKYAVYKINKNKEFLPNTTLVYDIEYVPRDDSFRTSKKACHQLENGIQAIFGPTDPVLGAHIQSICEALDVPHLEARIDFEPSYKEFSINLHPSQQHLNHAIQDIMSFLNWSKVAVIYEEDYANLVGATGLFKLQDLVKSPPTSKTEMYIRQANPSTYRNVLKEIRRKEIYKLIVDTNPANTHAFFRAILQLQMNDYRYHYMFTTFDIETFDLEDFKYNSVNITAFRLIDVEDPRVSITLDQMEKFQPIGQAILNKSGIIQAEPALMYDSVYVFAKGLAALDRSHSLKSTNLSCDMEKPWDDGLSLYNYINSVGLHGLTGHIEFKEGKRNNFKLDLLKLRKEELQKVGQWSPADGINITDPAAFYESNARNITLIVMTREEKPYVMVKADKNLTGNARYEGFCVDLLQWIASHVGFGYEIRLVPDRMYGVQDEITNEWNGMVRELMDKRADLAVASMTINYARESVIDFTKPFMNLGIGILFKIPTSQPTRLFSFMNPLAVEIWIYVLAAYLLVSFTLFVMARFSPYEWHNPHPCQPNSDVVENQFSMSNSFWFITGTFLRQGSGLNPKATSTRIVGGIWWFFTLIIISSYTANLAAFLTVERMTTPIENAADLAEQTEISYGTLEGGSTMTFFRDSKIEIYQKMWQFMSTKEPSVFVSSYEEGVRRVLNGNYAFLMESTMLDYVVQRDCNLTQVGGLLDSKGYGIATPKGSPWRDRISLAILELQEKGVTQILYDKWWKNTGDVCNRDDKSKEGKANALGIENIGGVFVVLLCGLALAIIVALLEFCWNSKKNARTDQQSLCSEMAEELRFAVRCHGSRQRPALRRNCTRCSPGTTYVPAASDTPHLNGESNAMPMLEVKRPSLTYDTNT